MRHHNQNRKFGRPKNQRRALLANLAISLFMHEKMTTTGAKAKEMRPFVEKLITRAKSNTLFGQRILAKRLYNNRPIIQKLTKDIAPRYKERSGGYTRITKLADRKVDGASMAQIELI